MPHPAPGAPEPGFPPLSGRDYYMRVYHPQTKELIDLRIVNWYRDYFVEAAMDSVGLNTEDTADYDLWKQYLADFAKTCPVPTHISQDRLYQHRGYYLLKNGYIDHTVIAYVLIYR